MKRKLEIPFSAYPYRQQTLSEGVKYAQLAIMLIYIDDVVINGMCAFVIDDLAGKQQPHLSTTSSPSSCTANPPTSSAANPPTSSAANPDTTRLVLLTSKCGNIIAKGTVFSDHDTIHGHPCRKECHVVSVVEVVQSGAQPFFEDPYCEGLTEGIFVEWPKLMISWPTESKKQ